MARFECWPLAAAACLLAACQAPGFQPDENRFATPEDDPTGTLVVRNNLVVGGEGAVGGLVRVFSPSNTMISDRQLIADHNYFYFPEVGSTWILSKTPGDLTLDEWGDVPYEQGVGSAFTDPELRDPDFGGQTLTVASTEGFAVGDRVYGLSSGATGIVDAVMKREELGSTGIGRGVAVPHTKHPSVDRLIGTVGISRDGVDFNSLDGEKVLIFFLLVSPPDRPGDHLRALENISRQLRDDTFCRFLRQTHTVDDIRQLLEEADNNQL